MPANFVPPPAKRDILNALLSAGQSSVAAGGIASFHASTIAVGLQVDDRLCGSLVA